MSARRYFLEIKYDGSFYAGWQIQPNALTVQEVIQNALKKILKQDINVVGCGRTDAGVHASQFFLHFDVEVIPDARHFLYKLNALLEKSIAAIKLIPVAPDAHTRFDAASRTYHYYVHFYKNPFLVHTSYRYNQSKSPDFEKLQEAASLLLEYHDFFPFCKSKSEVEHYKCDLSVSEWKIDESGQWIYEVTANRFLRGMVRLIVGMCLNVSIGKISIEEVKYALDNQELIRHAWSVPSEGLFLSQIKYPYL